MSHSDDGMYAQGGSFDSGGDEEPRHTQFLDLTNGEGGERYDMEDDGGGMMEEQHYYDEDLAGGALMSDYDHEASEPAPPSRASNRQSTNNGTMSTAMPIPTSNVSGSTAVTPGRVVESGQEHTGRWTREEHEAFLNALKLYGKEWKKVAAKVKTRTVVQTRTHAQKYFQKLLKSHQPGSGDSDGGGKVEMGVASEAKKGGSQKKSKRSQQRSTSTVGAAHLLTHLPSSVVAQAAYSSMPVFPTHGFSGAATLSDLPPPPAYPPPNTTSSTSEAAMGSYYNSGAVASSTAVVNPDKWGGASTISIVAPDPNSSMRRGFPEPSPAASGKRKLAELAAAQMLAGVAASSTQETSLYEGDVTPPAHDAEPIIPSRRGGGGLSLQIVNPENLGITYNETRKRSRGDQPSPTTPWDGQLEQLVRYVAILNWNVVLFEVYL